MKSYLLCAIIGLVSLSTGAYAANCNVLTFSIIPSEVESLFAEKGYTIMEEDRRSFDNYLNPHTGEISPRYIGPVLRNSNSRFASYLLSYTEDVPRQVHGTKDVLTFSKRDRSFGVKIKKSKIMKVIPDCGEL